MNPVAFEIFGLTVHWYGIMMMLGFLAGWGSWVVVGRREGRSAAFCSDLLFWIMIAAVVGSRLAYIIANLSFFLENPHRLYRIDQGGLIYYGGLIAGIIAVYLFARHKRQTPLGVYDFVATSLPLAHAFGRIGCFLNGCCHGSPHDGSCAVAFPRHSFAWHRQYDLGLVETPAATLPVHPVQLYEAGLALALYALLLVIHRKRRHLGATTVAYLMLYPVARFGLEFLRGDARATLAGWTVAQFVSILLFASGAVLWFWTRRHAQTVQNM